VTDQDRAALLTRSDISGCGIGLRFEIGALVALFVRSREDLGRTLLSGQRAASLCKVARAVPRVSREAVLCAGRRIELRSGCML